MTRHWYDPDIGGTRRVLNRDLPYTPPAASGGGVRRGGSGCALLALVLLLVAAPALLPLAGLVVGALALARHRADDGERPHGHHVGRRWRDRPAGEWHPSRPADDEPTHERAPRHQGPRDNLARGEQP